MAPELIAPASTSSASSLAANSLDRAIRGRSEDLLGSASPAKALADSMRSIKGRFTLGIYGKWGAGKTSFVNLLQGEFDPAVPFVEFSAWPYKSSDELWRALMVKIARDLYAPLTPAAAIPLSTRIGTFLNQPAFGKEPAAGQEPDISTFEKFMEQLNATLLSSIQKSNSRTADDDQALANVTRVVSAAVSAVSPLGNLFASLFGGPDENSHAQAENATSLDRIESIEKMKQLLQKLFLDRAGGKQVWVFIDDLDRCMPDVCLDLLEAIQVFLDRIDCGFIVAVDQELVGQGLKARLKDLLGSGASDLDRDFYARKGLDYFEKIIQLGVPVPEPLPLQIHALIGATFPAWASSSDLISAALGSNPRRVKQIIALLDYRYAVSRLNRPAEWFAANQAVFDKLVALHWRDPEAADWLRTAASSPPPGRGAAALEDALRRPASSAGSGPEPPAELTDLYRRAVDKPLLAQLLLAEPLLSKAKPVVLNTLFGFCDFARQGDELVVSKDPAFARLLSQLLREIPLSEDSIVLADFERLLKLKSSDSDLLKRIAAIAAEPRYGEQMEQVEKAWDPTVVTTLSKNAEMVRSYFTDTTLPEAERNRRRSLLNGDLPLSAISPGVISAFSRLSQSTGTAQDLVTAARKLSEWSDLIADLVCRRESAELCYSRRKFAKGELFAYCWPTLAARLSYDRQNILALEETTLQGNRPDVKMWGPLAADDNLFQFLRVRPHLRDMYPSELTDIAATAQATGTAPAAGPASSVQPQPSAEPAVQKQPAVSAPLDESLILTITADAGGQGNAFRSVLTGSQGAIKSWALEFDPAEALSDLRRFSAEGKFDPNLLAQWGASLFAKFPPDMQSVLRGAMQSSRKLRIALDLKAPALTDMPWEALFVRDFSSFPVLAKDWSIIRLLYSENIQVPPRLDRPPKILALLSAAGGLTTSEAAHILKGQRFGFELVEGFLTREQVRDAIQKTRPDVLYYFGHAGGPRDAQEAALLLAGPEGGPATVPVSARDFAYLWEGLPRMPLAVMLGNDTVTGGGASIAGQLVAAGTTCVIGASRALSVEMGLLFTRAFFPALFDSGNVESALSAARHALERARLDWAAFALVSSVGRLDSFNFRPQVA